MIAAAAAMLAACSSNDTFKEVYQSESTLISFSTYTQKATRAENSDSAYTLNLSDHHDTFKVYGYKNTSATPVFNGEKVSYAAGEWSYSNNRYWDKAATTYEFYAFAPYSAPFTFTPGASQKDGKFSIDSNYDKAGENASPKNSTNPLAIWNGNATTDVDLMIADTCRLNGASLTAAQAINGKVTLNFIHILSRLNITVKTIAALDPTVHTKDSLCVDSIVITNIAHAGTFDEAQGSVDANTLKAGTTARWTASNIAKYKYEIEYTATTNPIYVIEALIIPQAIVKDTINQDGTFPTGADQDAPYIKLDYSIYSYKAEDNTKLTNKESFTAYYNLAKVFGIATDGDYLSFNEGWQNTLNITISPAIISFDAKVAPWANDSIKSLIVQ